MITELCGRLGPIKQRDRGFGAGELLAGIAAARLAGEDFLTGLDHQHADAAGQQITQVPGLASTTAAGLARRVTPAQWQAAEPGLTPRPTRCCNGASDRSRSHGAPYSHTATRDPRHYSRRLSLACCLSRCPTTSLL